MSVDRRWSGWASRPSKNGSHNFQQSGYFPEDDPVEVPAASAEPIDMRQVRADDAFVEALANANRHSEADPLDERMASLLLSWRDDVNSQAAGQLVDLETASAAVRNAPRPRGKQVLGPLAAAAAVLVIAFTGVGLVARDAEPGNPLFGVTKVLYSEKARSVEAAVAVRTKLEVASNALASGQVDEAESAIEQARRQLPVVQPEDGQGDLEARAEELVEELRRLTPPNTPPATSAPGSTASATAEPSQPAATTTPPDPGTTTATTQPPASTTAPSPETTTSETQQAPPPDTGGDTGQGEPGSDPPEGSAPDGTTGGSVDPTP